MEAQLLLRSVANQAYIARFWPEGVHRTLRLWTVGVFATSISGMGTMLRKIDTIFLYRAAVSLFIVFHLCVMALKATEPSKLYYSKKYEAAPLPTVQLSLERHIADAVAAIRETPIWRAVDGYVYLTNMRQTWQFFSPNPRHEYHTIALHRRDTVIYNSEDAHRSNLENWVVYYMALTLAYTPKDNLAKHGLDNQITSFVHWLVRHDGVAASEVEVVVTRHPLGEPFAAHPPLAPEANVLMRVRQP